MRNSLVHRGKRSPQSEARHYIAAQAYLDRHKSEAVNRLTRTAVINHLASLYEVIDYSLIPDIVQGEVIVDSRGQGSFQL